MAKKMETKKVPERRKGPRTMHRIDDQSSPRDRALARADLNNFFLDVFDKHHGGDIPDCHDGQFDFDDDGDR